MTISQCFQELAKSFFINMDEKFLLSCSLGVHISEGFFFQFLNFYFNQAKHCFEELEEIYK